MEGSTVVLDRHFAQQHEARLQQFNAERPQRRPDSTGDEPRLSEKNIGFQMLQKAGWQAGEGLGAKQQGITTPLPAWHQAGREGLGAQQPANAPQDDGFRLQPAAAPATRPAPAPGGPALQPRSIASKNVGLEMLKRAGWKEGQGLGAHEQGAMTPLEPWENDGRKGIGASAWATSVTPLDLPPPSHRQQQQHQQPSKPPRPGEGPQQRSSKQQIGAKLRKRLRQEADEDADRSFRRKILAQFNEPSAGYSEDISPLLQKHSRLTAVNPLLQ